MPRKNILPLRGRPLICYTLDAARGVTSDENICVSTENPEIMQVVEHYGLKVPFVRPAELATDDAGMREVLLHALHFYAVGFKRVYKKLVLLQPTSPLRTARHIREAYALWRDDLDMVVSVTEARTNPYFNLFEEDDRGHLVKSKQGTYTRRQDAPKVWEYNGAIYLIKPQSLEEMGISQFANVRKYPMERGESIDIDGPLEFSLVELVLRSCPQASGCSI